MRFKGTFIWASILLALAVFVYLYEIRGGERRLQVAQKAKKVLQADQDEITGLTVRHPGETIVCQRTGQGWQLIEPLRAPGDETALEGLIGTLGRAEIERVVAETEKDLAQYGLDPPQATIEVISDQSPAQVLHLGYHNPSGSHVYARWEGDQRIFLTLSGLLSQAQKKVFDLRDKRVLAFSEAEVSSLTLSRSGETIQARRSGHGWMLEKPLQVKADKTSIESLLRELKMTRVQSFVEESPDDLSAYGLHQPELTVILSLDPQGALQKLHIGRETDGQRYARDDSKDAVFLIPGDLMSEIDKTPFDLRDKRVLDFDRNRVTELELISSERTIICQRDTSGQWQMVAPETTAVKKWELDNILSLLSSLKAESYVGEHPSDLSLYGLVVPRLQGILRDGSGQLAGLRIGAQKGDQVYACDASGAPVSLVDGAIVKTLSLTVEDLRKEKAPTS